jgi:hypothetical protein
VHRLKNELNNALIVACRRAQSNSGIYLDLRLAGLKNVVEKFEVALAFDFRERLASWPSHDISAAYKFEKAIINAFEDMIGSAEDGHKGRSVTENFFKSSPLGLCLGQ